MSIASKSVISENIRNVAVWGASRSGEDCIAQLKKLAIDVCFLIDKSPDSCKPIDEIAIIGSDKIGEIPDLFSNVDCVILAMGADTTKPREMLREVGFDKNIVSFREGASIKELLEKRLCVNRLLAYDDGADDLRCLDVLKQLVVQHAPVCFYGMGALSNYLLKHFPELRESVAEYIDDDSGNSYPSIESVGNKQCNCVFIGSTQYLVIDKLSRKAKKAFGNDAKLISLYDLQSVMSPELIPSRAWINQEYNIYPIAIPPIEIQEDLDFVLLDLPARFLGMMPNGLGYVHNILASTGARFQTLDMDMILYHRYHTKRIMDGLDKVVTKDGYEMKREPWTLELVEEEWEKSQVIDYFQDDLDELISELVRASPKMIGLSLHTTNLPMCKRLVERVREEMPDLLVIAGGYDCIRPEQGPLSFPDFDYMVIFEAESSLPSLMEKLLAGERPKNLPGVISRFDEKSFPFVPAPLIEDLDTLDFPRYEWTDIDLYRNYHGYQLTPIILSRGCRWSKCTFCAERFSWRRRSPKNMVDEIEWLASKGCKLFHFNDSDLSGDPGAVRGVCEEIIARGITGVSFVGQLRVQKGYTQEYFYTLKKAGFVNLRYGIDGWSKNTLKLHKKGYTLKMIEEVIGYTYNAGIGVSVNLVIGIPGETDEDIDETIQNIVKNRHCYDSIENINTLMLFAGSIYWEEPEKHGIKFIGNKEEIYRQYPRMIPCEYWFSEDPFINQDVRMDRLKRIVDAANEVGIPIGGYADRTINKLRDEQAKH